MLLDFWHFVMFYIYGSVQAIPTYRVYRLYDNIHIKELICVWMTCLPLHRILMVVVHGI